MIFEITQEQKENLLNKKDLKVVHADSTICHYCARKHFYDNAFDNGKCESCLHRNGEYYNSNDDLDDNFMGIECVTYKEEL